MKKRFLLLCIFCGLYTFSAFSVCGLSWASNFGSSVEGEQAAVTFTHTADCDSAHADFGYDGDGGADSLNFYVTVDLLPCFSGDGTILMGEGLELDSVGTHVVKITYFEDDGDAVADGYVAGIWLYENPNLTALKIWKEDLFGYITAGWAGTYLRDLFDNQDWNPWDNVVSDTITGMGDWFADWFKANYWLTATGFSTHGASDVAALWGDTLTYLITFRDSVNNAIADANKSNFHSSGDTIQRDASTFDISTDTVIWVDTVLYAGATQKNTEAEITGWVKATLEDTSNIARDATKGDYKGTGGACGTGSREAKIKAYEAAVDSEACENCEVKLYLVEDTSYLDMKLSAYTGSDGFTPVLSVDPDSYRVRIVQVEWSFDVETVSVLDQVGTQSFYLLGTKSSIPAPSSDSTTVIYGYVEDASGNFIQDAIITITLDMREPIVPTWIGGNDVVITELVDTTDANGRWDKEIIPNEYISPSGTRYKVAYEKENVIIWKPTRIIIVPYSATPLNINDL